MSQRCSGCRACIEGEIPDFASDEEEEAFWDEHSPDQFPLRPIKVRLRGRPKKPLRKQPITILLNPRLKERLMELAASRGIGYQTLIQEYLIERVEQEFQTQKPASGS